MIFLLSPVIHNTFFKTVKFRGCFILKEAAEIRFHGLENKKVNCCFLGKYPRKTPLFSNFGAFLRVFESEKKIASRKRRSARLETTHLVLWKPRTAAPMRPASCPQPQSSRWQWGAALRRSSKKIGALFMTPPVKVKTSGVNAL